MGWRHKLMYKAKHKLRPKASHKAKHKWRHKLMYKAKHKLRLKATHKAKHKWRLKLTYKLKHKLRLKATHKAKHKWRHKLKHKLEHKWRLKLTYKAKHKLRLKATYKAKHKAVERTRLLLWTTPAQSKVLVRWSKHSQVLRIWRWFKAAVGRLARSGRLGRSCVVHLKISAQLTVKPKMKLSTWRAQWGHLSHWLTTHDANRNDPMDLGR